MTTMEQNRIVETLTEQIWQRLSGGIRPAPEPAGSCSCKDHSCSPGDIKEMVHHGACRVTIVGPPSVDPATSSLIDHTLLKADATRAEIIKICDEAIQFSFASVCVNPTWVPLAAERLRCTVVKVCTVCGFPLGATLPAAKREEARESLRAGAQEVDMVINVGALKSGDWDFVREDIRGVAEACHAAGAITKVILETSLLNDEEKVAACLLARAAGADFVKTSTGFSTGGATPRDIALMHYVVGDGLGVKASGGVRTLEDVRKMVAAGATRVGASASVKIMEQIEKGAAAGAPATGY
jgi:deoxyribose-phosphate aldolase